MWFIATGYCHSTPDHDICILYLSNNICQRAIYNCITNAPKPKENQPNSGSQWLYVNLCMHSHLNDTVVPCMNSEALLLISEEKSLIYGKIYCLLPLLLKLEGLHSGTKQYFIFHSFCRILQLSER